MKSYRPVKASPYEKVIIMQKVIAEKLSLCEKLSPYVVLLFGLAVKSYQPVKKLFILPVKNYCPL